MAELTFWTQVLCGFFFASGSKSELKRGINVAPYSLENVDISPWLAFQLGFQEIAGSFQDSQL